MASLELVDVRNENRLSGNQTKDVFRQFSPTSNNSIKASSFDIVDARPILPIVSFFMGDLRDGLAMVRYSQ